MEFCHCKRSQRHTRHKFNRFRYALLFSLLGKWWYPAHCLRLHWPWYTFPYCRIYFLIHSAFFTTQCFVYCCICQFYNFLSQNNSFLCCIGSELLNKSYRRCFCGRKKNILAPVIFSPCFRPCLFMSCPVYSPFIRNNNHEILKHPHDAGYYLVWYQGTLYYE